jgi:hypothetical protein
MCLGSLVEDYGWKLLASNVCGRAENIGNNLFLIKKIVPLFRRV